MNGDECRQVLAWLVRVCCRGVGWWRVVKMRVGGGGGGVGFFFQAEDGIRDTSVTGVQTCALPICATRTRFPN